MVPTSCSGHLDPTHRRGEVGGAQPTGPGQHLCRRVGDLALGPRHRSRVHGQGRDATQLTAIRRGLRRRWRPVLGPQPQRPAIGGRADLGPALVEHMEPGEAALDQRPGEHVSGVPGGSALHPAQRVPEAPSRACDAPGRWAGCPRPPAAYLRSASHSARVIGCGAQSSGSSPRPWPRRQAYCP